MAEVTLAVPGDCREWLRRDLFDSLASEADTICVMMRRRRAAAYDDVVLSVGRLRQVFGVLDQIGWRGRQADDCTVALDADYARGWVHEVTQYAGEAIGAALDGDATDPEAHLAEALGLRTLAEVWRDGLGETPAGSEGTIS